MEYVYVYDEMEEGCNDYGHPRVPYEAEYDEIIE
jgi:hypothetical protein